ncbi:MAG: hypothetical protein NZL93_05695, partial [Chthoniobacterales bacterium]|nr:hypothetical protein [Chthoniobacterales bacterium]
TVPSRRRIFTLKNIKISSSSRAYKFFTQQLLCYHIIFNPLHPKNNAHALPTSLPTPTTTIPKKKPPSVLPKPIHSAHPKRHRRLPHHHLLFIPRHPLFL